MNLLEIIGLTFGASWTAGINLYATVAVLGLLQRFDLVRELPGGLDALANPYVIGVAVFLYSIEFIADKVPYVDTIWDAVHTFIRVPAGAMIALAGTADLDPALRTVALLVGGGLALSTHGTKATARAAANTSPEFFSNIALSVIEDIVAVIALVVAALNPLVILVAIIFFLLPLAWILPKVIRRVRRMMRSARLFLSGRSVREAAS